MLLKGIKMGNLSSQTAIACTLTDAETRDRRTLARRTVIPKITAYERLSNGVVLVFENAATCRAQVAEFIVLEQGCCGFLTFELEPDLAVLDGLLRLTITGPQGAEEVIDMFVSAALESPHVQVA